MKPLLTLGALQVTPYGLLIFAGAVAGALLVLRRKEARASLPFVLLLSLICGHVVWCLLSDTYMEYHGSKLLYQIWRGGDTLYGVVAGGALGALIGSLISREKFLDVTDALAPGAAAALFFARIAEYWSNQGFGHSLDAFVDSTDTPGMVNLFTFPLSYIPLNELEEFGEDASWYYAVWFWEAIAALAILAVLLIRRKGRRGDRTFIFLGALGLTQILFEQLRQDEKVMLTGFVSFTQIAALVSIIAVLIALIALRRPGWLKAVLAFAVLICAGLTVMCTEFVLDTKTKYVPYLYLSAAGTAIFAAALLIVARKRDGLLPAGMTALAGGILILTYMLEDPFYRGSLILYSYMAWALAAIGIAVAVCMKPGRHSESSGKEITA